MLKYQSIDLVRTRTSERTQLSETKANTGSLAVNAWKNTNNWKIATGPKELRSSLRFDHLISSHWNRSISGTIETHVILLYSLIYLSIPNTGLFDYHFIPFGQLIGTIIALSDPNWTQTAKGAKLFKISTNEINLS